MTTKFTAAVLATLIGVGLTAPAFAQQGQPSLGAKAAEQAAPKAADKAATKVQHGSDKAKADKAKDAVKKTDKKG